MTNIYINFHISMSLYTH